MTAPAGREGAMSLSTDWSRVISGDGGEKEKEKSHRAISMVHERPEVKFCTGSSYIGNWNRLGISGFGTYIFPHDVEYEGKFEDGMFDGEGTLTYPMGQKIDGQWVKGRMTSCKFRFADGLEYTTPWKYCQMPDRRFWTDIQEGLRPAGRELLTNVNPPRTIPEGCFDTGDGFYNPKTKCVTSPDNPKNILRIPTTSEERWIMEHCRKAWTEQTGYRPDLYEYWCSGRASEMEIIEGYDDDDDIEEPPPAPVVTEDNDDFDFIITSANFSKKSEPKEWWEEKP